MSTVVPGPLRCGFIRVCHFLVGLSAMVNLNSIVQALLQAWWLLLTAAGMAGLITYHSVRQTPPTYVATTTLMVGDVLRSPKPTDSEFAVAQNLANGYA